MKETQKIRLIMITPKAQEVIAEAARVCYDSFDKASLSSDERLIQHLINSRHHSVLEHASATFMIEGISRACSHQLVRHRLASYSQRSQRYVNEDGFGFVKPPSVEAGSPYVNDLFDDTMAILQERYSRLIAGGVKPEDARFLLPNACCTSIVMSANFREWRFIINERGLNKHAQWEIRKMALIILDLLMKEAPLIFKDLAHRVE